MLTHVAINVSVSYYGGFLPNIMLLTLSDYHWEARLNPLRSFCFIACMYVHTYSKSMDQQGKVAMDQVMCASLFPHPTTAYGMVILIVIAC